MVLEDAHVVVEEREVVQRVHLRAIAGRVWTAPRQDSDQRIDGDQISIHRLSQERQIMRASKPRLERVVLARVVQVVADGREHERKHLQVSQNVIPGVKVRSDQ